MKKSHLYIILALCSSLNLHCQDIITYNTVQASGTKEACKGFTLTPGFSFKAATGSSLTLRINTAACSVAETKTGISANQNYIVTLTPLGQTKSVTYQDGTISVDRTIEGDVNVLTQIQYFDGLGRPVQTVQRGVTPLKSDLVTYQEYDPFGREERSWMPSVAAGNNGAFMTLANVRTKANASYADSIAYSRPVYEASPLNRVLEQYGPGVSWKTAGASVKTRNLTNVATGDAKLICSLFTIDGTGTATKVKRSGNYAAGQLYVTEMKDEQGNLSYEFKDKLGQVVLTRQIENNVNHDTYYVYDDFGNLGFVLPPLASDVLIPLTGSWDNTNATCIAQYAYIYRYDGRNRCIWKKLPGTEYITCVYDKADRLIFTQDGEQRTKSEWLFSIPDAFGRTVLSGICKNTLDYTANPLKDIVVKGSWAKTTSDTKGYTITGITLATPTILTANYYDSYEFMGFNDIPLITDAHFKPETITGYGVQYTGGYKTLLTGTWAAFLDGSANGIYNVMYYDYKGQVIQTKSNNHLTGGIEKEYIAYNFSGQPTLKQHVHIATGKTTQTEVYTYAYDHAGRLSTTRHKLNMGAEVILAQNIYDELGRLSTTTPNNQANLKSAYTYNVRSWTKSITNPLFSQTLYYDESYGGSAKQYNGNISAMSWKTHNEGTTLLGYAFTYDNLSRLTKATYLGNGSVLTNGYETSYTYDKMGNMKTLARSGLKATSSWGPVDNLTMTYTGNQLTRTEDALADISVAGSMDFKNYSNVATEYTYNKNGAMTQDLNKGISAITYNSLSLPRLMDVKSPVAEARNEYTYTATGTKLQVVKKWNPNYSTTPVVGSTVNTTLMTVSETTDYVGNKIYENGALKRILIDNGYIEGNIYYFYIKDHLGNNRIVAKSDGSLIQATHYYPFGSSFAVGTGANVQPYKYNNKELDTMHGLNWYDYSARYKDDWRFTSVDPLAEKYYSISPYAYVANNPMRYVDPDGKAIGTLIGGISGAIDAHNKGGDVWAGAAEGAVAGTITGAVFDILVGSAIATGGTSLIVTSAIVAGSAGSGLGTIIGDQVGQVVGNVNKGMNLQDAANNTKPTPTAKINESIIVGTASSLIGAGGGILLNKATQAATKETQNVLSKNIVETTKTLQTMNASEATINQAVGKITTGMSKVGCKY